MRLEYPYPDPKLNPNARLHWAAKAKAVKLARTHAFWITKTSRYRPDPGPVLMRITICPPDRHRRDPPNAQAACKAMIDGIADAWSIDDNLFRITWEWGDPVKGGAVFVEVE